ncbi:MAG: ThuA domain-containing protein [Phycisphaera sp.]|nr:ThuA domain-containing protein [Phycisphaera sp.]
MTRHAALFLFVLLATIVFHAAPLHAADDVKPIRALMITGGCCHDYENQKKIISEGVSARANVTWTIVHEGGNTKNYKVSIYSDPDWAKGYDIVVHNECFGAVDDPKFLEGIVAPHKAGVPAVVIHCSMHSYRAAPNADIWREFLGVKTTSHESHHPVEVKNVNPTHPIMTGFGESFDVEKGELYKIEKVYDTCTPLAQAYGKDTKKDHVCVWVNVFGPNKTRVFGTTVGHDNSTMQQAKWLDMVARGVLWACDKLDDKGQPLPGYGPKTAAE